jgi:hypothetical protein
VYRSRIGRVGLGPLYEGERYRTIEPLTAKDTRRHGGPRTMTGTVCGGTGPSQNQYRIYSSGAVARGVAMGGRVGCTAIGTAWVGAAVGGMVVATYVALAEAACLVGVVNAPMTPSIPKSTRSVSRPSREGPGCLLYRRQHGYTGHPPALSRRAARLRWPRRAAMMWPTARRSW